MTQLILATTSRHRQKAFRALGLDFIARGSDVEEYFGGRPNSPEELVSHLAKLKAQSVAKHYDAGIVIGFDSVGWFDNKILEKPKLKQEAFERLTTLSGNYHQFYTGVYMKNIETGKENSQVSITSVEMRNLADIEIKYYLEQDPNFNTYALGYDPLGHYSTTFVKRIQGSYNNFLKGIPLEIIVEMINEF
ncbi:Maf family protein [Candidatus Woesearchaeota archaeon]|jgi:septum formation protein|nr:Maf family protein [Candidatus Woesearchaeota archaeon]MBT6518513.1 Maf family protein [Candidatus Woesearchaeota archaeon]MBT7368666.1 Maf family protein [Candidatus Woesearchaeota archaeon]